MSCVQRDQLPRLVTKEVIGAAVKAFAKQAFNDVDCIVVMMKGALQKVPISDAETIIIAAKSEPLDVEEGPVLHISRAITNLAIELDKPPKKLIIGFLDYHVERVLDHTSFDEEYRGYIRYALYPTIGIA